MRRVDISSAALAVAQRNVNDYALADRINLIRSDIFANLPEKDVRPHHQQPTLRYRHGDGGVARRVSARAAHSRSYGGDDGMDAVRTIIKDAPRFLNPGGTLVVRTGTQPALAPNWHFRACRSCVADDRQRRRLRVPGQARRASINGR